MKKEVKGLPVISIADMINFIGLAANAIWGEVKRRFRRIRKRVMS